MTDALRGIAGGGRAPPGVESWLSMSTSAGLVTLRSLDKEGGGASGGSPPLVLRDADRLAAASSASDVDEAD